MKKLWYLLFLTLMTLPAVAHAAELQRLAATARIAAGTVYPDRALTLRTASLNLKPGNYLVSFDNLPTLLQDDSVRVEGKGDARATIAGLEGKRVFLEESGEQRVKALDEEIRALELRSAALDAKKAGFTAQLAFLESIRVAWGERISKELALGRPTAAELNEASGLVGSGVAKVAEQSLGIDSEKQLLRAKIDALRRQRNEASGSGRKESKSVEVMLDVASPGSLTLELASVLPQASWVPAYDVRLSPDAKSAGLTFRALVRQQTGEDWNGVDLTLSTARPAIGSAPPELYPWRIALYRP
ncbi:MAG: mucoidy inhibitor MuiA family protein, partial [Geobacter sp.]|nr:mucoidy inhibitor MuiA family protein [Geobacter sp.]